MVLLWPLARFCYEDDCTKEDPLSQESFRKLAQPLPYSKQHHSKLVCYITKELMDTENPPLVLPNGYVYSTKVRIFPRVKYNDLPWGLPLIHKTPLTFDKLQWPPLRFETYNKFSLKYTDHPWGFGLINKAPLKYTDHPRGALCINLEPQG